MSFKKASVAAMLAASMVATPVLAQSAAPLSVVARSGAVTYGSNFQDDDDDDGGAGFLVPVAAIVAIILGVLAATGGSNDRPHSP